MKNESATRTELRARIKELHTHSYLTLLSIGQAVSFHLLTEKIADNRDLFFTRPQSALQFTSWAAAIETFIVLILVWNDCFMVVSIFIWIPSLIDARFFSAFLQVRCLWPDLLHCTQLIGFKLK